MKGLPGEADYALLRLLSVKGGRARIVVVVDHGGEIWEEGENEALIFRAPPVLWVEATYIFFLGRCVLNVVLNVESTLSGRRTFHGVEQTNFKLNTLSKKQASLISCYFTRFVRPQNKNVYNLSLGAVESNRATTYLNIRCQTGRRNTTTSWNLPTTSSTLALFEIA